MHNIVCNVRSIYILNSFEIVIIMQYCFHFVKLFSRSNIAFKLKKIIYFKNNGLINHNINKQKVMELKILKKYIWFEN